MNKNSLEDVLASIRNQVTKKSVNNSDVTDHVSEEVKEVVLDDQQETKIDNESDKNMGMIMQGKSNSLHKIHASIEKLKEIKNRESCVEIKKTESFSISEDRLESVIKPLLEQWLFENSDNLKAKLEISDIPENVIQDALQSVFNSDSELYKQYIQQIVLKYLQDHENYIKRTIENVIKNSVKDKMHDVIEEVIQKMLRKG